MYDLPKLEAQSVSGAGIKEDIEQLFNTIAEKSKSMTQQVNGVIGDLITQGQPGGNPACNALGNSLGAVGAVAGAENGGKMLGAAGDLCNSMAKSVQSSGGQQPASASTSGQ